jgi:hypothetical protein
MEIASLTFALTITIIGAVALMLKLMIVALALDDWWEMRTLPKMNPERMVADYEVTSSVMRAMSVAVTLTIGVVWLVDLFILPDPPSLLRITIVFGVLLQALLALAQGVRSLLFRRSLTRVFSHKRRPVGFYGDNATALSEAK